MSWERLLPQSNLLPGDNAGANLAAATATLLTESSNLGSAENSLIVPSRSEGLTVVRSSLADSNPERGVLARPSRRAGFRSLGRLVGGVTPSVQGLAEIVDRDVPAAAESVSLSDDGFIVKRSRRWFGARAAAVLIGLAAASNIDLGIGWASEVDPPPKLNVPLIGQYGGDSCGDASFAMVAGYHGYPVDIKDPAIRKLLRYEGDEYAHITKIAAAFGEISDGKLVGSTGVISTDGKAAWTNITKRIHEARPFIAILPEMGVGVPHMVVVISYIPHIITSESVTPPKVVINNSLPIGEGKEEEHDALVFLNQYWRGESDYAKKEQLVDVRKA